MGPCSSNMYIPSILLLTHTTHIAPFIFFSYFAVRFSVGLPIARPIEILAENVSGQNYTLGGRPVDRYNAPNTKSAQRILRFFFALFVWISAAEYARILDRRTLSVCLRSKWAKPNGVP